MSIVSFLINCSVQVIYGNWFEKLSVGDGEESLVLGASFTLRPYLLTLSPNEF